MKYCRNCGTQMEDAATVCPSCGTVQEPSQTVQVLVQQPVDNGGFGWGLLGCCIPIVGLILFLVWKDTKPKTAKAAGIGALVSVGISILWYIIVIAAGVGSSMKYF